MSAIETKLQSMGYALPEPFVFPRNNRRGAVRVGSILYVSGHGLNLPLLPGVRQTGKFGVDITEDEGYATARAVALTILATIKQELGSLDKVKQVVRLFGMCNAAPDYVKMPQVIDGASDLFFELYGPQAGCHARTAVGMATLPRGIAVEINGEFEIS
ncbi:MAG: RidA family protein [Candidatus Parcubacteria bacterium]|nr:RidA family protein [Burkholderiales bacterium]